MSKWYSYSQISPHGRDVEIVLHTNVQPPRVVGRAPEIPGRMDIITEISTNGVIVKSVTVPENTTLPSGTLRIPREAAQALHQSLARLFDPADDVPTLQKALDVERARVDKVLDSLIGGQT